MRIQTYLTFNGCCREAMTWYRDCLGGELFLQEAGNSPLGNSMPEEMKKLILHAALTRGPLQILGSDMTDLNGLIRGNAVSMALECDDETELLNCYHKLAAGGTSDHPPVHSTWGELVGSVTDKFGNHWLLHCEINETKAFSL